MENLYKLTGLQEKHCAKLQQEMLKQISIDILMRSELNLKRAANNLKLNSTNIDIDLDKLEPIVKTIICTTVSHECTTAIDKIIKDFSNEC